MAAVGDRQPHWEALLLYLQQSNGVKKRTLAGGHDHHRGQLSYARRQALDDRFADGTLRLTQSK
ncbi:hypothetical protein NRB14_08225 [Pseudomonas viridiflava]|nr:hypothetical protein [Pseudomonas viridiflava]